MCSREETYKQAHQAVEDVLFNEEDGKENRFEKELKKAFYSAFGRWFLTGGALMVLAVAGIYFQVSANTERIEEGGRFTQEEFDVYRAAEDAKDTTDRERLDRIEDKLDDIINKL